jgi:hypothetical protein
VTEHKAYRVLEEFDFVRESNHPEDQPDGLFHYPIFPDDELRLDKLISHTNEGYFTKVAPGLCITGILIPMELVEEYTEDRPWKIVGLEDYVANVCTR